MKISVVCPFFNEAAILEKAVLQMLVSLESLGRDWELVLVNDGSTDDSEEIVRRLAQGQPRLKLVSYPVNQGRGYALKTGIDAALGDLIITTEVDLSWGEDVVKRIVDKLEAEPGLDVVVASPNLRGGGYKNVPKRRVYISKLGNQLIRLFFTKNITMNTGMTRGYRRQAIKRLPLFEKGKEFHLESLLKLKALDYRIGEISAVLQWQDAKLAAKGAAPRKSSSKVPRLILSHLRFAVFANPIRYFWAISLLCTLVGLGFIVAAFYNLIIGGDAIYLVIVGLAVMITALLFFGFGITASQNNTLLKEIWRLQQEREEAQPPDRE
ncbi:MAG: glycosyltransferase family 2 protein [Desulfarculaceae bacterium]|jgi:glycosyltransferase involved in cell wall biosynthesis